VIACLRKQRVDKNLRFLLTVFVLLHNLIGTPGG
jgi:hypothetical protein